MEIENTNEVTAEVVMPTEKEKQLAIDTAAIDERNKKAEEKSRVDGFLPEFDALCKKWNVSVMSRIEFVGVGAQCVPRMDVVVQAQPKKEVSLEVEPVVTPTEN